MDESCIMSVTYESQKRRDIVTSLAAYSFRRNLIKEVVQTEEQPALCELALEREKRNEVYAGNLNPGLVSSEGHLSPDGILHSVEKLETVGGSWRTREII